MKYFLGIGVMIVGFFMVVKTQWFMENFGRNNWAEEHLGIEGGSRLMYKLLGILFIVGSFLGMTGMLGEIFISIFGRAFGL